MKFTILILILLQGALSVASADVNGSIEYIGDIRVLNLWGSWTEMGFAHGYLLGPDIKEVFANYFLELVGGASNYELIRMYFEEYFEVPDELIDYTQGMIAGISDSISIYSDSLGRYLDYIDICVTSSMPDLSALAGVNSFLLCTSVSGWSNGTAGDPELNGAPAVSRNLDYYIDKDGFILENNILITFDPDEGQDWISIGFPGFAGTLSGMNESGVSACLNMGNNQGTVQYTSPFIPICMAQALGLSDTDFNSSGQCDVQDMKDALTEWNRCNSYDIHVTADRTLGGVDSSCVVVEVNNRDGIAFRYSEDEPDIAPFRMILTNHHRVLIHPVPCTRYNYLMDSLTVNPDITLERLWNFMDAVGWSATPGYGGTIQTMIFMPEQLKIGVAFTSMAVPSYEQTPEWIEWSDLFPNHDPQGIDDAFDNDLQMFQVNPNPSCGLVTVLYSGNLQDLYVYDISGRKIAFVIIDNGDGCIIADVSSFPEGIYRISARIDDTIITEEIVLLK